ncbi:MAG: ABC transporter substrate-binding protein [Phycisphaerales bacterium]|nr:ABC transporter substrate-binding protein [Phycisphaerales bacterium]MCB9854188.1 ABC transporter substrate-binding protein [Phycisphaerales bacterium]
MAIRKYGDTLWVGTNKGLAKWDGNAWKSWTRRDGLPWEAISAIDRDDKSHDLWLGTWGGGLIRLSGGRFDQFTQFNSGLAGDQIYAVLVLDSRVWVASNGGVNSFDPLTNDWELYAERREATPQTALVGLTLRGPELLAASWCEGLRRLAVPPGSHTSPTNESESSSDDSAAPLLCDGTTSTVANAAGSLILASQSDLWKSGPAGTWNSQRHPAGDRNAFVHCVAAVGEETWLGTEAGLYVLTQWKNGTWISIRRLDGDSGIRADALCEERTADSRRLGGYITDDHVQCIAIDEQEAWIGTSSGLVRATARRPWREFQRLETNEKASSTPNSNRTEREPTDSPPANPSTKRPAIAILAPANRVIALPDAPAGSNTSRSWPRTFAINAAVSRVNADGGYRGHSSFDFAAARGGFERYGWGMPDDDVVFYADQENVLGMVGTLPPGSRISTLAALRSELPLINADASAASIDEEINPWMFRCRSNDPAQHRAVLDYVFDVLGQHRLAVLSTPGATTRLHLGWWTDHARSRGHAPIVELDVDPDGDGLDAVFDEVRRSGATVILTWTDAQTSASLLRRLRASAMHQIFVGCDRMVGDASIAMAAGDSGIVLAPEPCSHRSLYDLSEIPADPDPRRSHRGKSLPSMEDELSFDATQHLLEAINFAGADRKAVRDRLTEMRSPALGVLDHARWKRLSLTDNKTRHAANR